MRKRFLGLAVAMALSMTALVVVGSAETRDVLEPLDLADGMDPVKVPFLLATDDGFKSMVEIARELKEQETPDSGSTAQQIADGGSKVEDETPAPPSDEDNVPDTQGDTDTENNGGNDPADGGSETGNAGADTEAGQGAEDTPDDQQDDTLLPFPDHKKDPNKHNDDTPSGGETLEEGGDPVESVENAGAGNGESGEDIGADVEGVEDSWFDDVLFIGDSRTMGLRDYCRTGSAEYFCSVGMSVFNYFGRVESDRNFTDLTLDELLASHSYGKIFLGLGINECGYPMQSLMSAYGKMVDKIREYQPDAILILQGIMTVSRGYASEGDYLSPEHLGDINSRIEALADNEKIFYIDVNTSFADDEGFLPDDMSSDGCHLYIKYYQEWMDWIKTAVVDIPV